MANKQRIKAAARDVRPKILAGADLMSSIQEALNVFVREGLVAILGSEYSTCHSRMGIRIASGVFYGKMSRETSLPSPDI